MAAMAVPAPVRVLFVDDNAEIVRRATALLSPRFDVVGAACDGRSGLEAARALHPDVIVLDVSMPGMGGLDVAARLKAEGSPAAVVFMTIHDDEDIVRAAKSVGAVGYVLKPRLASDLSVAALKASRGDRFASQPIPDDLWRVM
jgi:DNA-binding NarL/FixJ family response regulator